MTGRKDAGADDIFWSERSHTVYDIELRDVLEKYLASRVLRITQVGKYMPFLS